ncbi:hypothetical protein SAMN05518866_1633 [Sphingobium sp. YR768]|nr:hypothetical protein SAMN05518866_1633 [Sphingobium sp. YR768]
MPRLVNLITLFLASPSDVQAEREVVSSCIQQWNQIHGFQRNVYFELLKWEASIAAGFGVDGQDVINQQLPNYDLFIGLFWTRLGTKTPRSVSGTAEEYERAMERRRKFGDVEIAFYFKDSNIDPRKLDLIQFNSLQDFEKRIQSEGAFSKIFTDDDSLRYEISLLLDRIARKFRSPTNTTDQNENSARTIPIDTSDIPKMEEFTEDLGLIDISENIENYSSISLEILGRIAESINDLNADISASTARISDISRVRQLTNDEMKPIISEISLSMDKFSDMLENSVPEFSESSTIMANNVRDLVRVSYDFIDENESSLSSVNSLKNDLLSLVEAIESSGTQMLDFRNTISGLQRMTVAFNKSKRRLVTNLDNLLEKQNSIRVITMQSLSEIDSLNEEWNEKFS